MDQKVTLIDKKSHQGIEVNASDKIQLSAQNPSVVQLKISSEDIKEYKKEGNNLVVVLKSGELITIMGFFDADNSLVLQDDVNHKLLWVEFSSNGEALSATYAELNDVGPILYGENDAASPWAWAAVPLTAGGILAWAGHDSGNDSDKGIGETNEGPSAPESVVIGNGDEWITADEIDADGKVDVTIDLPVDAVAGDSVIVNGEETVLTADDIAAGEIIVKVDAPNEGETLEVDVIIKDKDGNESDPTQAEATVDTTAPSAPDSVIIGNGDEWISADEIDADGKVDVTIDLPADVVAGDSVIVNGEETVLTADDIAAGEIIVKVDAPNEGETLEVEVSIKDAAGNESDEILAEAAVDTTAPSAPTLVEIGNGDDTITAGEVAAGEVEVKVGLPTTGIAVGDIVTVNGVEHILTQDDLDAEEVTIKVPMNAAENEEFTATATIKDAAGNESSPAADSAVVDVLGGSSAPDSVTIGNGDEWITADEIDVDSKVDVTIDLPADAVAGDNVIVNGEETVLTDADITAGNIIVKLDAPNEGETLEVVATIKDAAGNESGEVSAEAAVDTTGPSAPDSVTIGNGDEWITADEIDVDSKVDVTIDLPADAVAGDNVIVNGEETVLTDADITAGNIIVKLDAPNEGETLEVVATIKDAAGNESTPLADSAVVDVLVLGNDSNNAVYQESQVNPDPIGELTSDTAIKLLAGSSATDKLEFSIANGAQDVVITVKSESLVTVADAYSFTVINKETGQEYTVAASSTAQGGLVAGALGLEALGVIGDDSNGLRLDIHDLPPGDYEVVVQGDQSKLADILSTVSLEDLGSNTVETLILDTVTGLLKDALIGNDNIATGLLKQISVNELLTLIGDNNITGPLINTLQGLLNSPLLNNPVTGMLIGDLLDANVGDVIAGKTGGLLGTVLTTLGLGDALDAVVNDLVLNNLDSIGEDLFNLVIEPLIADVLLAGLIDNLSLNDALNGLLGSINSLLNGIGAGGLLPALDDVLQLVAQEILSNPAQLFNEVNAAVYGVDEKTYVAEGNVLANDDVVNGSIIEVNEVPITFNQTDVNGNYAIITGTHGTLQLYEDGHYIYTSTVTSGNATSVVDNFTYTVQDEYNNTEDAVLTITTDPVNETIDFSGTASDDILQGGAGDDILTGGDGADTAIYYLLDNADATGGNGTDTWTDFELGADADKIDISALLDGLQTSSNIGDYISVETNADGKAVISIDRDGASNGFSASDLLVLDNISPSDLNLTNDELLNNLLSNNQIVY